MTAYEVVALVGEHGGVTYVVLDRYPDRGKALRALARERRYLDYYPPEVLTIELRERETEDASDAEATQTDRKGQDSGTDSIG